MISIRITEEAMLMVTVAPQHEQIRCFRRRILRHGLLGEGWHMARLISLSGRPSLNLMGKRWSAVCGLGRSKGTRRRGSVVDRQSGVESDLGRSNSDLAACNGVDYAQESSPGLHMIGVRLSSLPASMLGLPVLFKRFGLKVHLAYAQRCAAWYFVRLLPCTAAVNAEVWHLARCVPCGRFGAELAA